LKGRFFFGLGQERLVGISIVFSAIIVSFIEEYAIAYQLYWFVYSEITTKPSNNSFILYENSSVVKPNKPHSLSEG